ncbi:MAG: hypothetical protein ABJJ44_04340 [Paraglaciecola sp.]|uniref:hypothetical protein n=1 Tax=Paraglaciecola sp. TaxID=1920173 RepID=UPI0032993BF0
MVNLIKILTPLVLFILSLNVNANVALSKHRLFFDNNTRTEALQLRNTGSVTMEYSAELSLVEMTEEGTLRKIEADPFSAIKLLRFSPKRGTIAPGGRQALRFAVRKPANLPVGEYRAVLNLTSTYTGGSLGNVNLNTNLSYNVPVIIRHGRTEATSELLEPKLVMLEDVPHIEVWQSLDGNRSLFGNFIATDKNGNEVGLVNHIAAYMPLSRRKVLIPLTKEVSGLVTIKYNEIAEFGGSIESTTTLDIE